VSTPAARASRLVRTTRLLAAAVLVATAVAVPAACTHGGKADPNAAPEPEVGPTTVRVQNQGFLDATVYVYRGGSRTRLGAVTGNSTAVFTIPKVLVQPATQLRFLIAPIGGQRQPISEEVTVSPGDQVGLVIPPGGG